MGDISGEIIRQEGQEGIGSGGSDGFAGGGGSVLEHDGLAHMFRKLADGDVWGKVGNQRRGECSYGVCYAHGWGVYACGLVVVNRRELRERKKYFLVVECGVWENMRKAQ